MIFFSILHKLRIGLITICFLNFHFYCMSQENEFSSFQIKKNLVDNVKWNTAALIHWKKFYSDNGWTRVGIDALVKRKLNVWNIYGGLVTNFTYDESISNNWEVRPWFGIDLTNVIYNKLKFNQMFRFEWRNLMFSDKDINKITTRYRYRLRPNYTFKENSWGAFASFEWYFLPNTKLGNRFINSRELSIGVSKVFSELKLQFVYTREQFVNDNLVSQNYGNTFGLNLIF